MPMIFALWEKGKTDDVSEILSLTIRYFLMLAIPLCFISLLVSQDLITLLASDKYAKSAEIIPIVLIGVFLQGLDFPFSAGLHFAKRTGIFLVVMIFAALLNIGLNILVVPQFGIMGAAYATLVSYIAYILAFYFISRRHFKVAVPYMGIIHYFLLGCICFLVVDYCMSFWYTSNRLWNVLGISVVYLALYIILLCLTDNVERGHAKKCLQFIRKGFVRYYKT